MTLLGICFGHQLALLGGTVADNPYGVNASTVELRLDAPAVSDCLLGKLQRGNACTVVAGKIKTHARQNISRTCDATNNLIDMAS
jgi:GMP synthase-like glutamine amidotransferase